MVPVRITSDRLNPYYDDAGWAYIMPFDSEDWADLSNMFDGCAFE